MPDYYEYKVVQVRESMIGNKMSSDRLEKLLNEHAPKAGNSRRSRART